MNRNFRQLCILLGAEQIFRTMAILLTFESNDLRFASIMVQTLNSILFTASELHALRMKLKELATKVKARPEFPKMGRGGGLGICSTGHQNFFQFCDFKGFFLFLIEKRIKKASVLMPKIAL